MPGTLPRSPDERISRIKSIPFLLMHVAAVAAFFTDFGVKELVVCVALYYGRMFFITAGYHRYFAHRGFKLGRWPQFLFALGGTLAAQKGPLWWAGHHRHHHRHSDTAADIHSPKKGFWWSHVGWILCSKYDATPLPTMKDFTRFPELRWLDRHHLVPPAVVGLLLLLVGGLPMMLFGGVLSTVLLYHGTFSINSLSHVFGRRRYVTSDTSRNSFLLALLTCGEGFHNNHHYYQSTANNGFFWWELDLSYYGLRILALLGIAHELRTPPPHVLCRDLVKEGNHDVGMLGELQRAASSTSSSSLAQAFSTLAIDGPNENRT